MRIVCEQCGAKYSVADEKSRDFEVRCRGCDRFIITRVAAAHASLTAQRNDNSVLFSLDGFMGMKPAAASASSGGLSPAASEGSGLVDVRAMRKMIDSRKQAGSQDAVATPVELLPRFTGAELGGLSADPLPVLTTPPPPATVPAGPSRGLLGVVAMLAAGILGLGALLVLDQPGPAPTAIHVPAGASTPATPETEPKPEPEPEFVAAAEIPEAASPDGETPDTEAAAPSSAPSSSEIRKRPRPRRQDAPRPPKTEAPAKSAKPPPSKTASDISVDCLLDPSTCKSGPRAKTPPTSKPPLAASTGDLPDKLGSSQIREGIAAVKPAAKACGQGTTVAVRFSVEGQSGQVVSAKPLDEHASSSVGSCVVRAAKDARFPRFAAARQGFTFKFRL